MKNENKSKSLFEIPPLAIMIPDKINIGTARSGKLSIPISVSLGLVAVLPGVFDPSFTASASYVIRSMFGGIDSFPLLAVPMFILSGIIMARGGISKRLFDLFSYFIKRSPIRIPGTIPARKMSLTDAPDAIPYIINGILGGIITPRLPATATKAVQNFLS